MAHIVFRGVTKQYPGGVQAVRDLDWEVEDGELVVLVGPSGCGKTTTLRLIAGLEEPTHGEIQIDGQAMRRVPPKDRDVAMVFQSHALYPHRTVFANLALGLQLRAGGGRFRWCWKRLFQPAEAARLAPRRKAIGEQVRHTAEVLGIEPLLGRMPHELSGGERQRVALGRAVVRQPRVYLLDEPLSHLDAQRRVEMRRELKRLHQRFAATMVYVTHDQAEALMLGDRLVVMEQGRIQQIGTPDDVYQRPRNTFVAGFLGTPPMNLLAGTIAAVEGGWRFESPGLQLLLPRFCWSGSRATESPVVLGIRAEDIALSGEIAPEANGRARVVMTEPLGDAVLVHLELAGASEPRNNTPNGLIAKVTARTAFRPGTEVGMTVHPACAHVFDSKTGQRGGE